MFASGKFVFVFIKRVLFYHCDEKKVTTRDTNENNNSIKG